MSNCKHFKCKRVRREEAEERAKEYSERTPREQLDLLDQKLGVGKGAAKERVQLLAKMRMV